MCSRKFATQMCLDYLHDELFDALNLEKSITIRESHHSFHGITKGFHHKIIFKELIIAKQTRPTKPSKASHDLIHLTKRIMPTKQIKLIRIISKITKKYTVNVVQNVLHFYLYSFDLLSVC